LGVRLKAVLADELNVKKIETADVVSGGFITYEVKPQLKTLGPKYGKLLDGIRAHLAANGEKIVAALEKDGAYSFISGAGTVMLTKEDVLISAKSKEGFSSESGDAMSVILDTRLTPELLEEGIVRELISKIQNLRKESGLEVTDRIRIFMDAESGVLDGVKRYSEKIKSVTLAADISFDGGVGVPVDVNGKTVKLGVEKV
jgi:isoleucyl-tRNA synthetase